MSAAEHELFESIHVLEQAVRTATTRYEEYVREWRKAVMAAVAQCTVEELERMLVGRKLVEEARGRTRE